MFVWLFESSSSFGMHSYDFGCFHISSGYVHVTSNVFCYIRDKFACLRIFPVIFEICTCALGCLRLPSVYIHVTLDIFWFLRDTFVWLRIFSAIFGISDFGCLELNFRMFVWLLMSSATFGICLCDFGCIQLTSRYVHVVSDIFVYIRYRYIWPQISSSTFSICSCDLLNLRVTSGYNRVTWDTFGYIRTHTEGTRRLKKSHERILKVDEDIRSHMNMFRR